ncbi:3'-5' exonuclease [Caproiciproducens sp. MSJ-32]|uniref:3'-5' exonuclease n=1 Tax=Caproiciproducens sp. MSJ-32 TaxID=2841527 RepID=UPI001C11107C|nr:3'-5' exonuclease [Caproiciproducens sp. MSJ-32]MBU5454822.1 UvrD-helicase domain-containing protein [Caproiciproducens sp. MSJ-32]
MKFNEEQEYLINELNNNILLLASAGTGKTNSLSKRISKIIELNKAKPSEILCITFTNKACKEMKERIEKDIEKNAGDIIIKTFHGFCFDIIKQYGKEKTDIFRDFIVFDEEDCKEIIKMCNFYNYSVNKLQQFIELIKMESSKYNISLNGDVESYKAVIDNIFNYKADKINFICSDRSIINEKMKEDLKSKGAYLIKLYDYLLKDNHGLDFSDLTIKAREIFKDEKIVEDLKNKFKFINIDEVQDTSLLEYEIIEKLFEGNNILLCGDIFQTIYSWRGSDPKKIIEEYKKKYQPKEIIFTKNYRSTRNITNGSLSFLKTAYEDDYNKVYKKEILSQTEEEGEKIKVIRCESLRDEAKYIYNEIKKLSLLEDISSTAILSRDNRYNIQISNELRNILRYEDNNFEFILIDQFKFFRRQEIKDIIAFLKLIINRYDNVSLRRILKRFPTGIGDKKLEVIESNEYRKAGIALSDFIDIRVSEYGEKYGMLIEEYDKGNIVVFDVESTGVNVTTDEIIQIAAIKINSKGEVIEKFEKFLKNTKSVANSMKVHGFSDEFLEKYGEDKRKVLKEFVEFSKDSVIVGHNVQYDLNILSSELRRHNLSKAKYKCFYDTLDIYRRFYPNLKNHKLESLSSLFKTENKPSHNAMDDILATKDLLIYAIENKIRPTSLERIDKMNKYTKDFNFISTALNNLFEKAKEKRPYEIVVDIINDFNIKTLYSGSKEEGEKGAEKIERLRDFYRLLREIDDKNKNPRDSLMEILTITSLSNGEVENMIIKKTNRARIPIITVHQSKGLEFNNVFLVGLNEYTFPSYMAVKNNNIEEEKRAFYVAITRAKKRLYLLSHKFGINNRKFIESSFINYIDDKYKEKLENN